MNKSTALGLLAETIESVAEDALRKYRVPRELNAKAKEAADFFGLTDSPQSSGFILPDGSLLDMSPRGTVGEFRSMPHTDVGKYVLRREVQDYEMPEVIDAMGGAVRMDPGIPDVSMLNRHMGIESTGLPNRRQIRSMADYAQEVPVTTLELSDDLGPASGVRMEQPSPGAINRWFNENVPLLDLNQAGRTLSRFGPRTPEEHPILQRTMSELDSRAGALGRLTPDLLLK
tara:strand:- start:4270 stop:4959 length:690 start_codon:yes stop_codon:yes gene_type:complete